MNIELIKVQLTDLSALIKMLKTIFMPLLEKYHDDEINPANLSQERIIRWFAQGFTTVYFVRADGKNVGFVRVIECKFFPEKRERVRLSPLGILPDFQNQGLAQEMFHQLEQLYHPKNAWELDTILQEKGNLHLYEKLGYKRIGEVQHYNEFMDLVAYEKE